MLWKAFRTWHERCEPDTRVTGSCLLRSRIRPTRLPRTVCICAQRPGARSLGPPTRTSPGLPSGLRCLAPSSRQTCLVLSWPLSATGRRNSGQRRHAHAQTPTPGPIPLLSLAEVHRVQVLVVRGGPLLVVLPLSWLSAEIIVHGKQLSHIPTVRARHKAQARGRWGQSVAGS